MKYSGFLVIFLGAVFPIAYGLKCYSCGGPIVPTVPTRSCGEFNNIAGNDSTSLAKFFENCPSDSTGCSSQTPIDQVASSPGTPTPTPTPSFGWIGGPKVDASIYGCYNPKLSNITAKPNGCIETAKDGVKVKICYCTGDLCLGPNAMMKSKDGSTYKGESSTLGINLLLLFITSAAQRAL